MDRRYTILAIMLILAAAGLLILPEKPMLKEVPPERMLLAIDDQARFLSTDLITEWIIGGNPTLQLIDVRKPDQFAKYALPGAINIPLDSVMIPEMQEILKQPGKNNVFYSNDDILADQVWQICRRAGLEKIFVMKGGLNYWFQTIIQGEKPLASAPSQDFDLYSFRMAARQYFTGSGPAETKVSTDKPSESPKKVNVIRKEESKSSGGGC